jgi:hypothetical protein
VQVAVIGHDDADRGVERAKAAHHPVLAAFLVVARGAHRGEQLSGDSPLAVAVFAGEGASPMRTSRDRGTPARLRSAAPARILSNGSPVTT